MSRHTDHLIRRAQTAAASPERGSILISELVTIVLISAVLLTVSISQLHTLRERARRVRCVGNLKQIAMMMNMYRSIHRCFPRAPLADFSPLRDLVEDYGTFSCPSTNVKVTAPAELDGGTSYRYFGRLADLRGLAGLVGGTANTIGQITIDGDENRGHGNDTDRYDEDNPGKKPRDLGAGGYRLFDPDDPGKYWEGQGGYGAVYDDDYSHHDGQINLIFLQTCRWARVHQGAPEDISAQVDANGIGNESD